MTTYIHQQVEAARLGRVPSLVSRVPSGWVVLCDMQFLRGYCILLPDPVVGSINDLDRTQRANYLCDMATVGDALMEVTGAYRINYAIFGNSEPALHAHIVPRYLSEPDQLRHGTPWAYAPEVIEIHKFDLERDRPLIQQIAKAILQRLS
jgi:diadenosine tetraphosphate (Ap4A) HIT family hydrolase